MFRTARNLSLGGCRAFSQTSVVLSKNRTPPWAHEKLLSEGYTREDIEKHGYKALIKPKNIIKPDTLFALHNGFEISWSKFKNHRKVKAERENIKDQSLLMERITCLGGELAGATFLVHRGAAVKLRGKQEWVVRDPETEEYDLPKVFTTGLRVEAIDMRDFHIIPCGFENLLGCENVRSLALKNQPFVDDWSLDAISGLFHRTLEFIDVSGCPKVTERGLSVLHRCKKLRAIYINDMPNVKDAELLAIHLEDSLPAVEIQGINYWKGAMA